MLPGPQNGFIYSFFTVVHITCEFGRIACQVLAMLDEELRVVFLHVVSHEATLLGIRRPAAQWRGD
jgi:hypothetical protein